MISENSNKVSNLTILKERSLDMTNRFQIHEQYTKEINCNLLTKYHLA